MFLLLWEVSLLWHKWFASKWVISRRWTFGISESNTELCFMRGEHTCKQSLNLLSSSLTEQNLAVLKHRIWNCYQFNALQEGKILLFKWAEKTSYSEVPGSKLTALKFLWNHFNNICMSVKYQWETNALCSDSSASASAILVQNLFSGTNVCFQFCLLRVRTELQNSEFTLATTI